MRRSLSSDRYPRGENYGPEVFEIHVNGNQWSEVHTKEMIEKGIDEVIKALQRAAEQIALREAIDHAYGID